MSIHFFDLGIADNYIKTTRYRRNNRQQEIVFKEAFGFKVTSSEESTKSGMTAGVHGRNIGYVESLIGSLRLSSDSDDETGLKQWEEAFNNPRVPVTATHTVYKI